MSAAATAIIHLVLTVCYIRFLKYVDRFVTCLRDILLSQGAEFFLRTHVGVNGFHTDMKYFLRAVWRTVFPQIIDKEMLEKIPLVSLEISYLARGKFDSEWKNKMKLVSEFGYSYQ